MEDKVISVKLTGDLLEKVMNLSKDNALTLSAQVRLILIDYFKQKEQ